MVLNFALRTYSAGTVVFPSLQKKKEGHYVKLDLLCSLCLLDPYNKMMETQAVGAVLVKDPPI